MLIKIYFASLAAAFLQVGLDLWVMYKSDNRRQFLSHLSIIQAIFVAILTVLIKNCEILVIYYIFYWLQRKNLNVAADLKLDLTQTPRVTMVDLEHQSFEERPRSSFKTQAFHTLNNSAQRGYELNTPQCDSKLSNSQRGSSWKM